MIFGKNKKRKFKENDILFYTEAHLEYLVIKGKPYTKNSVTIKNFKYHHFTVRANQKNEKVLVKDQKGIGYFELASIYRLAKPEEVKALQVAMQIKNMFKRTEE